MPLFGEHFNGPSFMDYVHASMLRDKHSKNRKPFYGDHNIFWCTICNSPHRTDKIYPGIQDEDICKKCFFGN
jgi:hypothetical protein